MTAQFDPNKGQPDYSASWSKVVKILKTQVLAAKKIGISQSYLSGLCAGDYKASAKWALAAERATNSEVPAWSLSPDIFEHHQLTQPQDNPALEDAS